MPNLGGRRKSRTDSPNVGWRNVSFRGYADYMQTLAFQHALKELMQTATPRATTIMCAEALPWRCHRSLIADALTTHGWEVRHIMSAARTTQHELTTFAVVEGDMILYPRSGRDTLPRLF
jgi:uncharacterized protein (DUF488 family)